MKVGRVLGKTLPNVEAIDLELLLSKVLNVTRANLKAYPERELSSNEEFEFTRLLERRSKGEPVAYLLGHKEFWSLDFLVTPDVLIPRPDTELLVEMALERLQSLPQARVLDLGTGCGAIALSIGHAMPNITVIATDASADALQVAKLNAKHLKITNVEFALGNWFAAVATTQHVLFDVILSNPPYVAKFDPHLTQDGLNYEPKRALVAGLEGMDDLQVIISNASSYLFSGGQLLVEHGYDQEALVKAEFIKAGFKEVTVYKDLAGNSRVTTGVWY